MWGLITTIFLGLYGVMSFYIGRKGWVALGKKASRVYKTIYLILFFCLIFSFPLAEIGEDILPPALGPWLTVWGGYSMVAVSYIFLLLLLIDIVRIVDKGVKFVPAVVKEHPKTPLALAAIVMVLVLATVAYGGWNSRNPVVTEYGLHVAKDAGHLKQLRIAMVSDLHYGAIMDTHRLDRMLQLTRKLKPDIILLAGDLTDGALPQGEAQELALVLQQLQAPYGIFAVPGNHDRDLRDDQSELTHSLKEAGIQVLKDGYLTVADSFYLIGRDDPNRRGLPARKDLQDIMKGVDPSLPLILLDHQPIGLDEAQANGIDLQLSGHTHRGQIFPANLITRQIYENDWGLLKKGAYHLVVSSGYGTWGPPLRIGNHPEVVSITMTFN